MGITNALEHDHLDVETLEFYSGHIQTVCKEMDSYIKKLNNDYSTIKMDFHSLNPEERGIGNV